MAQNWYLQRDGEPFGPYSQDHLLRLLRSGGGEVADSVRRADRGTWTSLSCVVDDYPELAAHLAGHPAVRRSGPAPPAADWESAAPAPSAPLPPAEPSLHGEPPLYPTPDDSLAPPALAPSVLGVAGFALALAVVMAGLIGVVGRGAPGPLLVVVGAAFCGFICGGLALAETHRPSLLAWIGLAGNALVGATLAVLLALRLGGPPPLPADDGPADAHYAAFQAALRGGDVEQARLIATAAPQVCDAAHGPRNVLLLTQLVAQEGPPPVIAYLAGETGLEVNSTIRFTWQDKVYPTATPLLIALLTQHTAAIDPLLAAGADAGYGESPETTPLGIAVARRDLALCRRLVEAGGDHVDDTLDHLLVQVAHEGDGAFARQLLTIGADANLVTPGGTALQIAIARGDATLVQALLESGADPNLYATGGDATTMLPPLHRAVKFQQYEIAQLLLAHRADPNLPTPGAAAQTPIDLAGNDQRLTDLLVQHGAKPGVKSVPPPPKKKKRLRDRILKS